jgi:hypothetical protein
VAAGVVLTAGLSARSWSVGLHVALIRAGEVLLGGVTAIAIAWGMSLVWMPEKATNAGGPPPASPGSGTGNAGGD